METHPDVSVFWNIWPFPIFVWTIFRVPLNILFFPIYFFTWWIWQLWNLIPEIIESTLLGVGGLLTFILAVVCSLLFFLIFPIPFAIFFWFLTISFGIIDFNIITV